MYSSLHNHSMYSLLDGYGSPREMMDRAQEIGLNAFAITEHGNLYSAIYFDLIKKDYPNIKMIYGCCLPWQLIYTNQGVKKIEDITVGEKVLTHTGRYKKVKGTMSRPYNGILYGFTAPRCNTVWLTGEHPILVAHLNEDNLFTKEWIKARDLKSSKKIEYRRSITNWNSYLCYPKQTDKNIRDISLIDYLDNNLFYVSEGYICKKRVKYSKPLESNISNNIKLSPAFMRLLGHYVSEGSISYGNTKHMGKVPHTLNFCFNFDSKKERFEQTLDDIKEVLKVKPTILRRMEKNTIEIIVSSVMWAYIFESLCGHNAINKKIPSFIYSSEDDLVKEFIYGVYSDAKNEENNIVLKMTSQNVVYGIRQLNARWGKLSKVSYREDNSDKGCLPSYSIVTTPLEWIPKKQNQRKYLEDENYIYIPLTNVATKNYCGEVYNLHVDEDNSYVTDFIVHNCELYECNDITIQDKNNKYFHLICLVRNEQGRMDLNKVITKSNFEGFYFKPRCTVEDIAPYAENFIISSACLASKIAREDDFNKCIDIVNEYKTVFPYFYLEMQSHSHEDQSVYNRKILELAKITNTPYIITTDSHAAKKEDLHYQNVLVQIGRNGTNNDKNAIENSEIYEGCYMQSEEEIHEIMDSQIGYENVCIGLEETNKLVELIDDVNMPFQEPKLPTFPLPDGFESNYDYVKSIVKQGWRDRGFDKFDNEKQNEYKNRIDYELSVIHKMGFDGYFLFVRDFIKIAHDNGIEVGKGRGSAAGSLVCYCMHITDIDPIKYGLIFERFLNPERVGLPDIDTDVGNRDIIIDALVKKYGEERVCQIINFSYLTPTVAITDVGKILGFNYSEMQKLSQKFTSDKWDKCVELNPSLFNDNPQYTELFDIASHLSGRVKTVSIHAGGVGVVDTNVNDYMPMKLGTKGEHVIQVDKHYIEDIGIVKFDLLGVSTLNLVKEIKEDLNLDPWLYDINNEEFENDLPTYELLASGRTNGVFQVESAGMKDLLIRLKPKLLEKDFEVISAILALYRPDSMGALEEYVEMSLTGNRPPSIHPDMDKILESTNYCMLYQEQMLEIVRKFGGRTYGGADIFRKAVGKKIPELVQKESEKLRDEIVQNGYPVDIANKIADEMATKGGYSFNKSHSYSYAVLCFETAWFKAHYPIYFFKALFNLNKDKAGAINKYILDAQYFGVNTAPPNINHSEMNFTVNDNKILFGFSAIVGIGESMAQTIIDERKKNGLYKSFEDLLERVPLNTSQVVALIKSGAIPCKNKRQQLIKYLKSQYKPIKYKGVESLPTYKQLKDKYGINLDNYVIETKGKRITYDKEALLKEYNRIRKIESVEKNNARYQKYINDNQKYFDNEDFWEFETLQIFINNNPFDKAYTFLRPFEEIEDGEKCTLVGIISKVQKKKDKNDKQFAYINIYSSFGLIEGIVWHSVLRDYEDLIKKGQQIAILCKRDGEEKVMIEKIKPYSKWLKIKEKEF